MANMKVKITEPGFLTAFILVTSLFFMWGLSYGLIDVLNKHFQATLHVSKAQSGLIQAAYFGAYFCIAIPAGLFMEKKGYKAGILAGLCLYALGALLFVPAANAASFNLFLLALFVIALGLGCLETAANPYSTALGNPASAETRLNLSQSFNGLGQFVGPLLGGLLFFSENEQPSLSVESVDALTESATGAVTSALASSAPLDSGLGAVKITYVVIAIVVLLLALLIAKSKLPDLRSHDQEQDAHYRGEQRSLLAHREFVFGVFTQFVYVAAQVGVGAFFINLFIECWPNGTAQQGAYTLSVAMLCLMLGRFISTGLMTKVRPALLLSLYALACILLTGLVFLALPYVSVFALVAVFFFISIMFPTIFAMGTKNLGSRTKRGSSYMIMAIVGGAIMPYFMGLVADSSQTAHAFVLPLLCFVVVAAYGWTYDKLTPKQMDA